MKPLKIDSVTANDSYSVWADDEQDRRKRVRTKLCWALEVYSERSAVSVQTKTEDLSSSGLYFLSPTAFGCGESLIGRLTTPTHDPSGRELTLTLECRLRVVRAAARGDTGSFGVGCQIEDYHLVRAEPPGSLLTGPGSMNTEAPVGGAPTDLRMDW